MFALIFANRLELWWYRDPAACASYTALSIWSSASRNLFDGDVRLGGGGGLSLNLAEIRSNRSNSFVSFKEGLYQFQEILMSIDHKFG